jgi:hypothetical protein
MKSQSMSFRLWGLTSGPRIAATVMTPSTTMEVTAARLRRSRRAASDQRLRPLIAAGAGSSGVAVMAWPPFAQS